jgi:hypothetical protein
MTAQRRGFLKDPRLRSKFHNFLAGATTRRSVPGLDLNRAGQGVNAILGRQTHRTAGRPRVNTGGRVQQFHRNRSNEQGGLARPSAPQPFRFATPTKPTR